MQPGGARTVLEAGGGRPRGRLPARVRHGLRHPPAGSRVDMKVAHAAFAGVLPVGGWRTARDPNRIATSRDKVGPTLDTVAG